MCSRPEANLRLFVCGFAELKALLFGQRPYLYSFSILILCILSLFNQILGLLYLVTFVFPALVLCCVRIRVLSVVSGEASFFSSAILCLLLVFESPCAQLVEFIDNVGSDTGPTGPCAYYRNTTTSRITVATLATSLPLIP